ncbi:MAG: CDP-diacylglycerol--glycerol-3-phosphate 3-phosphatidyltransferase [Gemmatimonadota bacterium]
MNLPNAVTTLRVVLAPVVAALLLRPSAEARLIGFLVFLLAALSDLWDGELARRRGQITDFGKLVDPIADKLLLAVTLIPFYLVTRRDPVLGGLPIFDGFPLWALLVFLARELLITGLRMAAVRLGRVVPAGPSGKLKALAQNIFIGAMILWLAFRAAAVQQGWSGGLAQGWEAFHGWFTTLGLVVALTLTVYSMGVYLFGFQRLFAGKAA